MAIVLATMDNPYPATPQNGGVEITFVNRTSQLATNVTFKVTNNGRTDTLEARGKYAEGKKIITRFPNFAGTDYFRDEPDACKLAHVTFADGSTWTAPEFRSAN